MKPQAAATLLTHRALPWGLGAVTVGCLAIATGYLREVALQEGGITFPRTILLAIGILAIACALQCGLLFSWRHAAALALSSMALSWLAEAAGLRWGLFFGSTYDYTAAVGPHLPGKVPAVVPLVWFGLSHLVLVLHFRRNREVRFSTWNGILRSSLWSGYAFVVVDLLLDPVGSGLGGWKWTRAGAYYGVPLLNSAGWMLVGSLIFAGFAWLTRNVPVHSRVPDPERHARNALWWGGLLLVPVAGMALSLGRPGAVLAFLLAGLPLVRRPALHSKR